MRRAYRFLVEVGSAIGSAPGEAELAREICRLAVDVAGYRLAWVGYRRDDEEKTVQVVASHGDDGGYLERAQISWGPGERGSGPTGSAIRTGVPQVSQNIATDPRLAPWRAEALERGFRSSAALPLGGPPAIAVLNVYADEPDAFDAEELVLLERVALDLHHAILAARGRHELAKLQTGRARLEQLDAMARSAAMLAHDMNNYLAIARLCLDRRRETSAAEDPLMNEAKAALDKAIALNERLVSLSREEVAPSEVFEIDLAIRAQAAELGEMLGPAHSLELRLGAPGGMLEMDRVGFDRILSNLALNAREAMPEGGRFTLETERVVLRHPLPARWLGGEPGEYVRLRATDTGRGIDPALHERIFEPFFSTKAERGSGLGLASVFSVVRAARGLLALDSEPGRGSTFELLLPLSRVETPGAE